ncbi:hypothetical protein CDD81_1563 [Ophiocordyceps australis]|uniref:DNA replication ATP-dependent helicase/nuclease n=1 Tax=Ophiocordyceps australis TaxID=1399860 RepID=A0A2C5XFC5_9HYPO|nr:hypothetical protein CDD81_1563 [Ophiocordyceps australis]
MSLRKSFSERIGLSNNRSWQRSHSHPANIHTPKKNLPPVSDVTRNKLSKFEYQAALLDESKENVAPAAASDDDGSKQPRVTRLNWSDLKEPNAADEDPGDDSPNDKVFWNDAQVSAYPAHTPMLHRSRKRAKSSSPLSSPCADNPTTPAVNVDKLKKALKAPHADPALELWDRYSLGGTGSDSARAKARERALAQLMASSSPKPSTASRSCQNSFRRTSSGGVSCPRKRKYDMYGDVSQAESDATSKDSLVSALLDSVSNSLNDKKRARSEQTGNSPSQWSKRQKNGKMSPCPSPRRGHVADRRSPSDYGDDDFDDDTFAELEASIIPNASTSTSFGKPRAAGNPCKQSLQPAPDEFEDLGDDAMFDNADEILSHAVLPKANAGPQTPLGKRQKHSVAAKSPGDEFEDFFNDQDIDFDAVELAATQSARHGEAPPSSHKPKTIQRYLITGVVEGEYVDDYGQGRFEKILIIQADNCKHSKTVHLRGAWYETPAHEKAYVHVIGQFSGKGQCIVDDGHNLLILHPDQLISATVVADSFGCMRRAVLQDRVKATNEASPPLVYGTMLHEIFQEAMLANRWDLAFLGRVIDGIIKRHIEDLYIIKVDVAAAREHLQSKMTELSHWARAFVSVEPRAEAIVEDRNGKKANMAITKLLDVEEHVWSPMYGLKGNIDATVEVIMGEGGQQRTLTVPFEVKTGRNANSSHMAQTALYTLLLSDRYDIDIACGILYYMETSKTMRIPAVRHELRHMVMQRNHLACYIRERSVQLPPMLKNKHVCGRCYAKTTCFVYHRLADEGDGETSGMGDKFDEAVKHLTATHREFFLKWEKLLTLEEKEGQKTKRELWTMTSKEREKKSRCFANVVIEQGTASVDGDCGRINRFHYTFVKAAGAAAPGFSFLESELSVGEPIVVSDEQGHFALAIGYVTAVRSQRISVAVDRRLHNARIRQAGFDERDKQVFASIMEVGAGDKGPLAAADVAGGKGQGERPLGYRLDQDEFSNGMATVRNNLVQLMANEVPAAAKLRRLIVDLAAPRFKGEAEASLGEEKDVEARASLGEKEEAKSKAKVEASLGEEKEAKVGASLGEKKQELNIDQRRAVDKVMRAQDYALVLGMPGTGKTTTIAHIIRALTAQGKSVLLTCHTHTAVDNILLKLRNEAGPILRLGAAAKVHAEVREFAQVASQRLETFAQIDEAWQASPIVATTCLGINHALFGQRSFDYCIVDEASQITLPICAGPIRLARAFVLVGDHNQLPPVVRNEAARAGGLDVSLFKRLSDAHPHAVVRLEHQYRMCDDVMALSNTLIYNGRLRCGYEALRTASLSIPNMAALSRLHHDAASLSSLSISSSTSLSSRSICPAPVPGHCWLHDALAPDTRVRFLNTDSLAPPAREVAHGKRIVNPAEVRIVTLLVHALVATGVAPRNIGVMTHYRAQLVLLRDALSAHAPDVEMHTTDRFQGRDKDVVVLSLVRANDGGCIGDLLRDWRRINVAFTRAKTKLLVVGSAATLACVRPRRRADEAPRAKEATEATEDRGADMLARFVALMRQRNWLHGLPPHALDSHLMLYDVNAASQPVPPNKSHGSSNNGKRAAAPGKENRCPQPLKRATVGARALLQDRLITRDVLNGVTDGAHFFS